MKECFNFILHPSTLLLRSEVKFRQFLVNNDDLRRELVAFGRYLESVCFANRYIVEMVCAEGIGLRCADIAV